MILSDSSILDAISKNDIVIEPYDRDCLGTNSYDVHLSKHLACYVDDVIDAKKHNHVEHFEIPEEGVVLNPGKTYLGSTLEYTCLLYTSPSPRDGLLSRMPSSA